jgi:hypothetical protein
MSLCSLVSSRCSLHTRHLTHSYATCKTTPHHWQVSEWNRKLAILKYLNNRPIFKYGTLTSVSLVLNSPIIIIIIIMKFHSEVRTLAYAIMKESSRIILRCLYTPFQTLKYETCQPYQLILGYFTPLIYFILSFLLLLFYITEVRNLFGWMTAL